MKVQDELIQVERVLRAALAVVRKTTDRIVKKKTGFTGDLDYFQRTYGVKFSKSQIESLKSGKGVTFKSPKTGFKTELKKEGNYYSIYIWEEESYGEPKHSIGKTEGMREREARRAASAGYYHL